MIERQILSIILILPTWFEYCFAGSLTIDRWIVLKLDIKQTNPMTTNTARAKNFFFVFILVWRFQLNFRLLKQRTQSFVYFSSLILFAYQWCVQIGWQQSTKTILSRKTHIESYIHKDTSKHVYVFMCMSDYIFRPTAYI